MADDSRRQNQNSNEDVNTNMITTTTTTITTEDNKQQDNKENNVLGRNKPDIRLAIVGNVDSGKSTLIGVLTAGDLDDGRGQARARVFVHRHEGSSGRTSYCSQHILGFGKNGAAVHQPVAASASVVQKNKAWRNVVQASERIITLVDLAGHERYLKTTIAGLTGTHPDYAVLLVGANMGVTQMTKEHMGVVSALSIPVACVITKVDLAPENVFAQTKQRVFKMLRVSRRKAFEVKTEKDLDVVLNDGKPNPKLAPIFVLSCVTGEGLDLLTKWMSRLQPRRQEWTVNDTPATATATATTTDVATAAAATAAAPAVDEFVEFAIDEDFQVPGVGLVVSGTVMRGTIRSNTTMYLGPFADGSFHKTLVKTIHCKRVPVEDCCAGTSCAVAVKTANRKVALDRHMIRRGMVLLSGGTGDYKPVWRFRADIMIMHHSTSIKAKYEAVIHCGMVRTTATLLSIDREFLRSGDKSNVVFQFINHPEYVRVGDRFIFREGTTKGVGKIREVFVDKITVAEAQAEAAAAAAAAAAVEVESKN